jgi:tetratricopeptide (TPR) repeat protein
MAWLYARHCQRSRRQERAIGYLRRLAAFLGSAGVRARCLLVIGQLSEQTGDFEAAAAAYAEGQACNPTDPEDAFLLSNNRGYCLNQLGAHAEAEGECRRAIEILSTRHNAYKNLGVALEGLGRHGEAVSSYLQAIEANPADRRALDHLEQLLARAPHLLDGAPGARAHACAGQECRFEAVRGG